MRLPRSSGILLHPTSLPGPHGSGDLGPEAYRFVDWLVQAGQSLWQILPLGGIGAGNSPYMSSSAFAGNALLIDLDELQRRGWLTVDEALPDDGFETRRIAFDRVVPWRLQRLRIAARRFASTASDAEQSDFATFQAKQAAWLDDYALFMALVDAHDGASWSDWDEGLKRHVPQALAAARESQAERIAFYQFCQWCFFRQWLALRTYANQRGVKIVGDAPIFIAYQSAEVWARQDLFELDENALPAVVAGVPPDAFSDTGQRWGNPLYRWPAHARDGYAWWTDRIRRIFDLVDLVRIDHFRGFAAYWEIDAKEATAMAGHWVDGPGAALFEAVAQALGPLPIIAEDLGVITPDVVALRQRFDFPGMYILQFAFGGGSDNPYLPHNHRNDGVVYPGTHDNDTTLGWWATATDAERHHVRSYLATDGGSIHWDLIRAAFASVADTAIHPLQDVLGLDGASRMNFPGYGQGYWEWRFDRNQLSAEHASRLRDLCVLYRRDGTPLT